MKKKLPFDRRRTLWVAQLRTMGIFIRCPNCGEWMWWSGGNDQIWRCSRVYMHHRTWIQMEPIVLNIDNDIE